MMLRRTRSIFLTLLFLSTGCTGARSADQQTLPSEEEAQAGSPIPEIPTAEQWVRMRTLLPVTVEQVEPGLVNGAPFLTLSGGALERELAVPLWLAFSPDDDVEHCSQGTRALVLQLDDGRVYVHQYNYLCGDGEVCKILDPTSRSFSVPEGGCLRSEGVLRSAELIAPGWVLVTGNEGRIHVHVAT